MKNNKKLKTRRSTKKNKKQKGGFIAGPTNPYAIAAAVLVGGLYIYGALFENKAMDTIAGQKQQAASVGGGKKFRKKSRRTRKKVTRRSKRGGTDEPINMRKRIIQEMKHSGTPDEKIFAHDFSTDEYLWDSDSNQYVPNPNFVGFNPQHQDGLNTLNDKIREALEVGETDASGYDTDSTVPTIIDTPESSSGDESL